MIWLQRSCISWLKEGDRNTKYSSERSREAKNKIKHLHPFRIRIKGMWGDFMHCKNVDLKMLLITPFNAIQSGAQPSSRCASDCDT
jgi:hypothetical protein